MGLLLIEGEYSIYLNYHYVGTVDDHCVMPLFIIKKGTTYIGAVMPHPCGEPVFRTTQGMSYRLETLRMVSSLVSQFYLYYQHMKNEQATNGLLPEVTHCRLQDFENEVQE